MVAPETYAGAALAANAIWTLLDQRRYEDILTYLTPDCAWERTEGWRHGHDDLRASFLARPADLLSRHVVTNFTAEQADDLFWRTSSEENLKVAVDALQKSLDGSPRSFRFLD